MPVRQDIQLSFLLSSGRTGTVFTLKNIERILAPSGAVVAVHDYPHVLRRLSNLTYQASVRTHTTISQRVFQKVDAALQPYYRKAPTNGYYVYSGAFAYSLGPLLRAYYGSRCHLAALVRDGRSVVRSVMNRKLYASKHNDAERFKPHHSLEIASLWKDMTAFQKAVWWWKCRTLAALGVEPSTTLVPLHLRWPYIRLEDLVMDLRFCSCPRLVWQRMLLALGLPAFPPQAIYSQINNTIRNRSRSRRFPPFKDWSSEQKAYFRNHADDLNIFLGYHPSED